MKQKEYLLSYPQFQPLQHYLAYVTRWMKLTDVLQAGGRKSTCLIPQQYPTPTTHPKHHEVSFITFQQKNY